MKGNWVLAYGQGGCWVLAYGHWGYLLDTRVRRSFNTYFSLVMSSASAGTVSMGPLWDYDLGFANVRKVDLRSSQRRAHGTHCCCDRLASAVRAPHPAHAGAQSPLGRAGASGSVRALNPH